MIKAGSLTTIQDPENFTGADATGVSGAKNRVLTLANTSTSKKEQVFVSGLLLHSGDYTISHLSASSTITFLNALYDDMKIKVVYFI